MTIKLWFCMMLGLFLVSSCYSADPTEGVSSTQEASVMCGTEFKLCYQDHSTPISCAQEATTVQGVLTCSCTRAGVVSKCLAPLWCLELASGIDQPGGASYTCPTTDPVSGLCCPPGTSFATMWAPTYPLNRVYNMPTLLGTWCTTTSHHAGTMTDKCSVLPSTCGFLYCIAN